MNQKYFPFYDGTGVKTQTLPININPKDPVSLDPRDIISEWSEDSLKSLSPSDLYVGLKIYDLEKRILRICKWIPSEGNFDGNACIWDILYSENDNHEWINVFDYEHEETIDEKIDKAESLKWRYSLKYKNTYISFAAGEDIEPELNNIIVNAISKNTEPNDNYMAFTYSALATKNKVITPDFTNYTSVAIEKCINKKIAIICPANIEDRGTDKRSVESIEINGSPIDFTLQERISLSSYNSDTQSLVDYDFDLYLSNQLFDKSELENIVANNSLSVNIKA